MRSSPCQPSRRLLHSLHEASCYAVSTHLVFHSCCLPAAAPAAEVCLDVRLARVLLAVIVRPEVAAAAARAAAREEGWRSMI